MDKITFLGKKTWIVLTVGWAINGMIAFLAYILPVLAGYEWAIWAIFFISTVTTLWAGRLEIKNLQSPDA